MWFALWALFEYGSYSCHVTLRNIKLHSGGVKSVPTPDPDYVLSRLFDLVSCPNYLYEVCVSLLKNFFKSVAQKKTLSSSFRCSHGLHSQR